MELITMNLKTKLGTVALLLGSVSIAQATAYDVHGTFYEPMVQGGEGPGTEFKGSFDWDGTTLSGLSGTMNEAMRGDWTDVAGHEYIDGNPAAMMTPYPNYMLSLGSNLQFSDTSTGAGVAGTVTATIFKENDSNVYYGNAGTDGLSVGFYRYGTTAGGFGAPAADVDGNDVQRIANENAFFTMVFDHDGLGNITSLGFQDTITNAALVNQMIYGDCTLGSLMSMNTCMAGEITATSPMQGIASSLDISVSAVPVPAAAWLFGGALMSLIGANRRKSVLPA